MRAEGGDGRTEWEGERRAESAPPLPPPILLSSSPVSDSQLINRWGGGQPSLSLLDLFEVTFIDLRGGRKALSLLPPWAILDSGALPPF